MKVNIQGINIQIEVKHPKPLLNGLRQIALENSCPITVSMMDSKTCWVYGTPSGQTNSIWDQVVEVTEGGEFKIWIGEEFINLGSNPFPDKPLTYEECFIFNYSSFIDYKEAYFYELENPSPGAKYYGFFKKAEFAEKFKYKICESISRYFHPSDGIWIEEVEIMPNEHLGLVWRSCISGVHPPVVNTPTTFYTLVVGTRPTQKKSIEKSKGIKISSFMTAV
jgi:hypothetical protein